MLLTVIMKLAALLAVIYFSLTASPAIAVDDPAARNMAWKDYKAAMAKIRADDSAATQKCRSGTGTAVEACLIQARGKRMRAEQQAKTNMDRAGQIPSLPETQAKAASTDALKAAEGDKRSVNKDIYSETKAADAECNKLTGAARTSCATEVMQRRNDGREVAGAMYKKSRSDVKALRAP